MAAGSSRPVLCKYTSKNHFLYTERMGFHYIIQGLFVLLGLISLLATLWNADWFFTARNTQFVVGNVGRNRARLFYGVLGLLLIGMGIFFFCQTIEAYTDIH